MSLLSRPVAATGTLRVLAALLSYPDADVRKHLPEMGEILRRERALPPDRVDELDALLVEADRGRIRSTAKPSTCSSSIAGAARRCTCSSTCTATRAIAARR